MKNNSLPEIKLNVVREGDNIEKIFNIDLFELKQKINIFFNKNVDINKIFNKKDYSFSEEINDITLQTFMNINSSFTDKEILYMIWAYIDYHFRFMCLYGGEENADS